MSQQSSYSKADPSQITVRTFDESNDAIRVVMPATEMAISIDADSGDNIATTQSNSTNVVHVTHANTAGSVIFGPTDITKYSKAAVYLNSTTALAESNISIQLQVSPDDLASVWVNMGSPVVADQTLNAVIAGSTQSNVVARRVQLVISGQIASGETLDAYLVLST